MIATFLRTVSCGILGLTLAFSPGVRAAGNILLWPIDPVVTADNSATELWIENNGSGPVTMQVRVIGWQQIDGRESYQPYQQDVVASPPIVRIEAGKKQLIRLIRQITPTPGKELAYRVLIDEIPQAGTGTGVKLQMRYSVPLFVYGAGAKPATATPPTAGHALLSWRHTTLNGQPAIEIVNQGQLHARLSNVSLDGRPLAPGLLGYVLANSSQIWPLPSALQHSQNIQARINSDNAPWQATAQR